MGMSWLEFLWFLLLVTWDVLTQKLRTRGLPPASSICHPSVRGKTCIVTGATSGIGRETARELLRKGAFVVLACRNTAAADELVKEWKQENPEINAEVAEIDLTSFSSVRRFADEWKAGGRPVHILINNAGVFRMADPRRRLGDGGHELHFVVNYLSGALLTLLLLPSLAAAKESRVVNVNSIVHFAGTLDTEDFDFEGSTPVKGGEASRSSKGKQRTRGRTYNPMAAYAQSKLAQVMFTNTLQRKLPESLGVDVVALEPGEVMTDVVRTLPAWLMRIYLLILPIFLLSPSDGARASLFCATDPSVRDVAGRVREHSSMDGPFFSFCCRLRAVAAKAQDESACECLWGRTLNLLGLPEPDLLIKQGPSNTR